MPAQSSWKPRIPIIVKALRDSKAVNLARPDIEKLLEVGRSQADSVMRAVGVLPVASSCGGSRARANMVLVAELITYLECHFDAAAEQEFRRRQKLEKALRQTAEEKRQRRVILPVAPGDQWMRLKDLDVAIEAPEPGKPGRLIILFDDPDDCLRQLYRTGMAIGNDEDQFRQLTTPISTPKGSAP